MHPHICCIISQRNIPKGQRALVRTLLAREVQLAVEAGCVTFLTGLASSSDLLFAQRVVALRAGQNLFLEAALAWPDQLARSPPAFQEILQNCSGITAVSTQYHNYCDLYRNRYLVRQAGRVIAVYNGDNTERAHQAVQYAMALGRTLRVVGY